METTFVGGKKLNGSVLETFLVEWKLQQEQEKAERRLALETFLVEWKQALPSKVTIVVRSLKPS